MDKVLHFDLDTSFVKIKEIMKNKDFIELEFWAISDEYPNNNRSHFPYSTFQYNIDRNVFYNKPILGKFNNVTNNYETHVYKKKYDPEFDMEYYDYEDGERPLGIIRESDRVRVETDDNGLHWIVFSAVLWVKYNYQGVKRILKSKSGKVSVEVTVTKYHEDDNGIEIFDEWVFDGITILGYKPNTKVPVKEGINNARLTINEIMNERTFSNQLKTLCFAYEELNNDIKEESTHLYKEENDSETEGCIMSYADKRNALESILFTFVENNENVNLHVYDFNENIVFFHFSDIDYKSEYSIDEDGNIFIDFENKIIVDKSFNDKSNEKDEPTDDEKECKMDDEEDKDRQDEPKEDDECGKVGCSDDETIDENKSEEKEESSEDFYEEKKDEVEDSDSDNTDDNEDDDKDDCKDDCCNKFSINDEMFTGEELVDKYIADMAEKDNAYISLQKQYSEILSQKEILEEKVKKYEEQEAKIKMDAFCNEVSNVAKKEGFNEEEINSLVERCKKGEFADIKDAIKEIAYIVYTKKEVEELKEDNVENEKSTEFSAKVTEPKKESVEPEVDVSSFGNLKKFVNK